VADRLEENSMKTPNGARAATQILAASILALIASAPVLSQEPVQLTYWNWAPHIDEVVAIWNESHPDIQVTVSRAAGAAEIVQKLSAAHTAGNPPDVTNVTYQDLPALVVNGLVADITPEMAPLKEQIAPVAWNLVTFGGTSWATPQGTSPMMLFYRKDILEELGIAVPTTWEEFAEAAKAVRAADPTKYLAHFPSGDPGLFAALTHQVGAQWWQLDGNQWTVDIASEEAKQVAGYWQDLVAEDAVSTMQTWSPEWSAAMADGSLLGFISAVWAPPLIANLAPDTKGDWGVVPLPRWSQGTGSELSGGVMGGSATAVSSLAKHPEQAKEFAIWITNNEEALSAYVRLMNIWPAQLEARKLPQLQEAPAFLPDATNFYEMAAEIDADTPSVSWGPNVSAAFDVYKNAMGEAVQNKAGFAEVLDAVQKAAFDDMKNQGYTVAEGQ
jgi:multiple sugar transport system substrate-binding protein